MDCLFKLDAHDHLPLIGNYGLISLELQSERFYRRIYIGLRCRPIHAGLLAIGPRCESRGANGLRRKDE